ncbi:MAG TPA: serine/threonine-protein kinase [Polyangiaceae bacterium]|nr:serine/threonine-protein kinase [Polyangiaceae bacterium]
MREEGLTADAPQPPFRLAERYEVLQPLGRGGMASVYRARDDATGNTVALKVLAVDKGSQLAVRSIELFEREFHTLVQLAHPRIVRAYDYGVDGEQPYYAMELLDGGDLRELSPLPWPEVCTIAYEICSALSLLHSRGVVHRDLTPRNIRRTASGQAKLIDFGLLSPMGETTLLAGTPPFVAPELMGTMSLDGRSDLFALGTTLYYALTKRQPYPARSFEQLRDAWRSTPLRPSKLVPEVPPALEDLILGMLRIDPGSRPQSAAEVMHRLVPLLPVEPADELRAARAYLSTPKLVGRGDAVSQFRKQMLRAVKGRGGAFTIVGDEGSGRSRMLDAFVLEAKLVGAVAVRAGYADAGRPFGVAASIATQIHRAAPSLARSAASKDPKIAAILYPAASAAANVALGDVTRADLDRTALQEALRSFILAFASSRALVLAIDDVDRIDEPSAALLASLTWEAGTRRLVFAGVVTEKNGGANDAAVSIIHKHAAPIALGPLSETDVTALLASLFGDVPNLQRLAARVAALSGGRPRECMACAQYLVDQGVIGYAGGSWTIPAEIPDGILPASVEEALALRLSQLGPLAREIGSLLAENLLERLTRVDLLSVELGSSLQVDAAVDELRAARIVSGDSSGYALLATGVARTLRASLDEVKQRRVHDALCRIHERAGRHVFVRVYHGCRGENPTLWLDRLGEESNTTEKRTDLGTSAQAELATTQVARALESVRVTAERFGRPERELQAIWVMLASASSQGADPAHFYAVQRRWLANLKRDSGHDDWQRLDPTLDPAARAMTAIGAVAQRYAATPEHERNLSPQAAIHQLVSYTVIAIAIAARAHDVELQASLPELLEPFASLNPVVAAMLKNARATLRNGLGQRERAYALNVELVGDLGAIGVEQLKYVDKIRAAVCYSLAAAEVLLGIPAPFLARFASEEDAHQRVSARFMQMIAALQQGDTDAAEAHRRAAELLALQNRASSMFSTLPLELETHAAAGDLTGVRQVRAGIQSLADALPGWRPMMHVADAHYLRLCGDLAAALAATELAIRAGQHGALVNAWVWNAKVLAVELLTELGRAHEAGALGNDEIEACRRLEMPYMVRSFSLALAGADAKEGRFSEARGRVEAVIAEQKALGVSGLRLAQSYEVLARIALEARDKEGFERALTLTGELYRRATSSALRARYERLIDEARQVGLVETAAPAAIVHTEGVVRSTHGLTDVLSACASAAERAGRALALLCDGDPPTRGHLLLSTPSGLTLAASNIACDSVTELKAFASQCIEREQAADDMETGALHSASLGTMTGAWQDLDGTAYETVLLGVVISGTFCIAGIALLVRAPNVVGRTGSPVAESIARALIEAGDAVGIAAA